MFRKRLRYCFFSILLLTSYFLLLTVSGCVPKTAPPPQYKDFELTLQDIVSIAKKDIETMKLITSITVERYDNPSSSIDASVLLKTPDWLQVRLYSLGLPVGNYIIKNHEVHSAGRGGSKIKEFAGELYRSIFWWDGLKSALMQRLEAEYVIKTENRVIRIDNTTLLPQSQEITVNNKKVNISYEDPQTTEGGFWYPSIIKVEAGSYRFLVEVKRLIVNPQLEESDFKE
ncbi:MAG: hypothetical protein HY756_01625 [Nitrospirae bacterium]|nr:hypothetical protein [Nitrospirota bacterium]